MPPFPPARPRWFATAFRAPARSLAMIFLGLVTLGLPACDRSDTDTDAGDQGNLAQTLTIYSGRSRSLVAPLVEQFQSETGVRVQVRYGETAQLAVALREEGDRTPADLFWAQDAGALGAMVRHDRFIDLPADILDRIPAHMRNPGGQWVATSGRARTLAYAPARVDEDELPASVFELTDERYRGRVGWAPTNASFQAFVTAMRVAHGDERTRQWLSEMKANRARDYANNTSIIEGIAAGEVDFGLPNHYYLLRFKANAPDYPVEQTFFEAGDIGNLVNVAGTGVLTTSDRPEAALAFVRFLLEEDAQRYFAREIFEYPVAGDVAVHERLQAFDALDTLSPPTDLDALEDLDGTLRLLRQSGVM